MTSLRSCISSSDGRRYVAVFTGTAALVCVLVAALAVWGYRTGTLAATFNDLYQYQLGKIRAAGELDTVFVGDSSLGNAIDARRWRELSGRPALNLSLTGAYGYAGSLNMLRRILAKGRPRQVVIFHTVDMLTRAVEHDGYLRSTTRLLPFGEVPPRVMLEVYVNLDTALGVLRRVLWPGEAGTGIDPEHDAVQQAPATDPEQRYQGYRLETRTLNPQKLHYLRRLAALCAAKQLDCVYVHGPVVESACRGSSTYFDAANRLIDSTGLNRARETPLCMPYADVGDAPDHARPERRPYYTQRYFELLAKNSNRPYR
jgi:hypothetical protein